MSDTGDLIIENGVLREYRGPGGDVTVPAGVTALAEHAFFQCAGLRSVRLPEGLLRIGSLAFYGCPDLRAVRLPESLTDIAFAAFADCEALAEIALPRGLKRLNSSVFSECRSLRRVSLPEGLRLLDDWAFFNCGALTEVRLPESLAGIGARTFSGCTGLTELRLPKGLGKIRSWAFADCTGLRSVTLPERPFRPDPHAFSGCRGLADGEGLLILGGRLCEYLPPPDAAPSAVADVRLPDTVTDASGEVFKGRRLVLRVRRWFPRLADALEGCDLLALVTEDASGLPRRFRRAAGIGPVLRETPPTPEELTWLRRHASGLCREAFRLPELLRFLCGRRLLPPGAADDWLAAALAGNDPALTAALLEYEAALGPETLRRARAAKRGNKETEGSEEP